MATQNVDTGLPAAGVALVGVVVTASMSGMEQFPPGEDAFEGVRARGSLEVSTIPTIVLLSSRTESTGAVCTEVVEIVQARGSPADCFAVGVAKRAGLRMLRLPARRRGLHLIPAVGFRR